MQKKNKFGPAPLPSSELKLVSVKVGFTMAQLAELDANRGHYPRAAYLRAAALKEKLKALPPSRSVALWTETSPIQSCFYHINEHAQNLNSIRLNEDEAAAARALQAITADVYDLFKKFRSQLLGGGVQEGAEDAG